MANGLSAIARGFGDDRQIFANYAVTPALVESAFGAIFRVCRKGNRILRRRLFAEFARLQEAKAEDRREPLKDFCQDLVRDCINGLFSISITPVYRLDLVNLNNTCHAGSCSGQRDGEIAAA